MNVNRLVGNVFRYFGLDVRRAGYGFHTDAYDDQRSLLSGRRLVQTIFDVGANVGQSARRYRAVFPTANIHCFEPFERSFQRLQDAVGGDSQVKLHRLAISDAASTRTLFVNKSDVTNSLLPTRTESFDYIDKSMLNPVGTVEVRSTTLDIFCREAAITKIHILKMDVQGAELLSLLGASSMLSAGAIDLIYTEVSFVRLYDGQALFDDVCRHLAAHDYTLYGLYNLFSGRNGFLTQADAIFLSPDMRDSLRRP
jgi:FkbM family methyltransferase